MSTIDEALSLLKDGKWHTLKEITEKLALSKPKAEKVVSFLNEYDFIKLNEDTKEVRIQPTILEFIKEIQRLEKENTSNQ
ncbi:MAG: hypothetical protein CW691_03750 [Candidatus Bathyarchaeum sp.]|nr:MAG: hypothetical protein CW691_03750 [Candidatus Bathyarchaeum sp.]